MLTPTSAANASRRPPAVITVPAEVAARILSAAVLLAALCPLPVAHAQGSGGNVVSRLRQAAEAVGDGRLAQAEELLDSVLSSSPRDADALNLLGVVRAQQ